jgi:hypothetical protein
MSTFRIPWLTMTMVGLSLIGIQARPQFEPYPGARTEPWVQQYERQANDSLKQSMPGARIEISITSDPFEKVVEFYRQHGKERPAFAEPLVAMLKQKVGREVKATYVIFDDADSPVTSASYLSIQRPATVSFEPLDVRDVTVISRYLKDK